MALETFRQDSRLQLRPAREDDFAAITRLVDSPAELFLAFPAARWPLDLRQLQRLAEERLDLTVCCVDEQTVGFANLYGLQAGQSAFIGNVIIRRDYRGMGLGRALLNHMLDLLTEKYRLEEARISVFGDNRAALLLYHSLGFAVYGEESRTSPSGNAVVLQHMRCPLPLGEPAKP